MVNHPPSWWGYCDTAVRTGTPRTLIPVLYLTPYQPSTPGQPITTPPGVISPTANLPLPSGTLQSNHGSFTVRQFHLAPHNILCVPIRYIFTYHTCSRISLPAIDFYKLISTTY